LEVNIFLRSQGKPPTGKIVAKGDVEGPGKGAGEGLRRIKKRKSGEAKRKRRARGRRNLVRSLRVRKGKKSRQAGRIVWELVVGEKKEVRKKR